MKEKLNQRETIRNLKKTWYFARKQKRKLISFLCCSIILAIISAVTPVFTAQQVLKMSANLFDELIKISLFVFIIEITRNIFRYFFNRAGQIFFRETLLELQYELSLKILNLETAEIDKKSSGVFIDRINKDSSDIADVFSQISSSLSDVLINIGVLFAIFIINKWLFLYFIVTMVILYILKKMRMKKYFAQDIEYRKLNEKNTGLITELIRGIRDIRVLNANDTFVNMMKSRLIESNEKRYEMNTITRKFNVLSGSVQDIFALLFVFLGVFLCQSNILTISNFVISYMYQSKIYMLLDYVAQLVEFLKKFNVSANRVFEILDDNVYKKEKFGLKHIDKINGDFEFKNVEFSYVEGQPILKDLSFKIKANEMVAFVGKSGGGKTTVFSLLTKLYNVKDGEILIDGNNINDLDKYSIRNNISIITQMPYIFNFSIRDNLRIVKENLTDEEMIKVCKLACLHDYIMSLPEKYDTLVGEGGLTLSGGQRQRLAIARALLKNTEIILFDEATSALDNETQQSIQDAINNMKNEYTILIIAHRLSTVINCNRIIVIDDGKVIAEGTHGQLMDNCSLYKNLYEKEL